MKTYKTREAAQAEVRQLEKESAGTYMLNHGEYARPSYKARKVRGKELFGIWIETHYYQGTLNAPKSGFLSDH